MATFAPSQCLPEYIHEYKRLALAFDLSPAVAAIGCSSLQLDGGQNLFSSAKTLFPGDIVLFEQKKKGHSSNEETKSLHLCGHGGKKHEKGCGCSSSSVTPACNWCTHSKQSLC